MEQNDFDRLIEHYPRIRRAALVLSNGNSWDADDLAQETMLQAARGWRRFAGTSQVHTWLYSILLNQHRRRLRSQGRWWRTWREWFERQPRPHDEAPDEQLEKDEWRTSVWSAVATLPAAQMQTILLRYAEDLTYDEIAEVMRCPIGTVKSRMHHGLAALEKELGDAPISVTLAEATKR